MDIPESIIEKYMTCLVSLDKNLHDFIKEFDELNKYYDLNIDWDIYMDIGNNSRLASDTMYRLHRKYPKIRDICERMLQKNPKYTIYALVDRRYEELVSDDIQKNINNIETNTFAIHKWVRMYHDRDPEQKMCELIFISRYPFTNDEIESIRTRFPHMMML